MSAQSKAARPPIRHYGLDRRLMTIEHQFVDAGKACEIIDQRASSQLEKYDDVDKALIDTMFGFSVSNDEFVEITLHGAHPTHFKYEFTGPTKFLFFRIRTTNAWSLDLEELDMVKELTCLFFQADHPALVARLEQLRAQKT